MKARNEAWDDAESEGNTEEEENEKESKTNPFSTLAGQLHCWLRQLPVVGFNSGKYDLNAIKQLFVTYLMKPSEDGEIDETRFVIKRDNTFMCFSTDKLKFLDMVNFLAPGYMYDSARWVEVNSRDSDRSCIFGPFVCVSTTYPILQDCTRNCELCKGLDFPLVDLPSLYALTF